MLILTRPSRSHHGRTVLESKWTLVLPPLRDVPHWNAAPNLVPAVEGNRIADIIKARSTGNFTYVTWSDLLDLRPLSELIDVMEYEDFLAINGPEISRAVHVSM